MLLQPHTVKYEDIQVGDKLPSFQKYESQQNIDMYVKLNERPGRERDLGGIHHDPEYAEQAIFNGTVNYGVTTVGFMSELLQKGFPMRAVQLGTLSMRAIEPVRPNDVITYSGVVTAKRVEGGKRLVDLELRGTNQHGQMVASSKAIIPL